MNHSTYLKDETGNRRFWPVACGRIDLDALARDRDQLLAEAVVRYRAGDVWWLDSEPLYAAASAEQEDRMEGDPWETPIEAFLAGVERAALEAKLSAAEVTMAEMLERGVNISFDRQTRAQQMRVAAILQRLGWIRQRSSKMVGGKRPRDEVGTDTISP